MPGSFWGGPPRNNRKKRSLLGRKIHSENDLPEQDTSTTPSLSLPQQLQQQPHTTLILPENVKTILIAGTPECWNLTTSATPYSPTTTADATATATAATSSPSLNASSHCDTSQVTLGSEFSPAGASTIDEEEPYEGGLNWLLPTNNNNNYHVHNSTTRRKTVARYAQRRDKDTSAGATSTEQQQQLQQKEPSSMVVMYRNPASPSSHHPQQALHVWCK